MQFPNSHEITEKTYCKVAWFSVCGLRCIYL